MKWVGDLDMKKKQNKTKEKKFVRDHLYHFFLKTVANDLKWLVVALSENKYCTERWLYIKNMTDCYIKRVGFLLQSKEYVYLQTLYLQEKL